MKPASFAIFLVLLLNQASAQTAFDSGRAAFSIGVNNEIYPYRTFSTFVLPRERVVLRIPTGEGTEFNITADAGTIERTEARRFVWVAPEQSGLVQIVASNESGDTINLNAIVMLPANRVRNGSLNGYQIGQYPRPLSDDIAYEPPRGFIEVTESNRGLQVSPHFVLGQFVSDRSTTYPKYIVLRERLLLKLETMLERINQTYPVESFAILSAYRTPAHNESIGGATHSRHIYGGAAAIIVDRQPADGRMDDLNGDGEITRADAQILFDIADRLFRERNYSYLAGGLAVYPPNANRGPYLHVDARGVRARWRGDTDLQALRPGNRAQHPRDFR